MHRIDIFPKQNLIMILTFIENTIFSRKNLLTLFFIKFNDFAEIEKKFVKNKFTFRKKFKSHV